jgi:elongator complex protein 2
MRSGVLTPLEKTNFMLVHSLVGHEDWVQCMDATHRNGSLWIATGAQDNLIRIWKISPMSANKVQEEQKRVKDLLPSEEIKLTETIFEVGFEERDRTSLKFFSIRVETILSGHDDKIFGLQWNNFTQEHKNNELSLLSCSMDKTMIVWKPEQEQDSVWVDSVRVGEVGGNTLGFLGCQFGPDNKSLLAYSFNGALHFWAYHSNEEIWKPAVSVGGHFSPVQDLDWEQHGRYFVTVSLDQTTRVHAPWNYTQAKIDTSEIKTKTAWHEIARPQVHGHDLFCITMLPGHRIASGADEKIIRTFEATKMFLNNLSKLSKINREELDIDNSRDSNRVGEEQAQGASVPSLGLSNKPILYNSEDGFVARAPEEERHVKDQFPDFYFTPETHTVPPPEESLIQNTLWPELQKLYGHGNELFAVCSNPKGTLIASACTAKKADQADIILWDAKTWKVVQRLSGHSLTVTQIEFSPCGKYLLSGSRDRSWHLFKSNENENKNDLPFILCANTDKKTSVHQRIIWSCCWSHDSKYFATGSRDKKIAIWSKLGNHDKTPSEFTCLGEYGMACEVPMLLESSVTALAFSKFHCDGDNTKYIIAAGLEIGKICIILWDPTSKSQEWTLFKTLSTTEGHHKTVKRLKFRPINTTKNEHLLASCGEDNIVKLHRITFV